MKVKGSGAASKSDNIPKGNFKSAGSNVQGSRLNEGPDDKFRTNGMRSSSKGKAKY